MIAQDCMFLSQIYSMGHIVVFDNFFNNVIN